MKSEKGQFELWYLEEWVPYGVDKERIYDHLCKTFDLGKERTFMPVRLIQTTDRKMIHKYYRSLAAFIGSAGALKMVRPGDRFSVTIRSAGKKRVRTQFCEKFKRLTGRDAPSLFPYTLPHRFTYRQAQAFIQDLAEIGAKCEIEQRLTWTGFAKAAGVFLLFIGCVWGIKTVFLQMEKRSEAKRASYIHREIERERSVARAQRQAKVRSLLAYAASASEKDYVKKVNIAMELGEIGEPLPEAIDYVSTFLSDHTPLRLLYRIGGELPQEGGITTPHERAIVALARMPCEKSTAILSDALSDWLEDANPPAESVQAFQGVFFEAFCGIRDETLQAVLCNIAQTRPAWFSPQQGRPLHDCIQNFLQKRCGQGM